MPSHIRSTPSPARTHRVSMLGAICWLLACQAEPTQPACCAPVGLKISVPGLSLAVGDQRALNGWAVDSRGGVASASVSWSSADITIATVGEKDGLVTAISPGNTTVTGMYGMFSATATVSVRPAEPPVAIAITPAALGLLAGGHERLRATLFDVAGKTTHAAVAWSSADPSIASVGQDGQVTGLSDGITSVSVTSGSLRATASVTVIALSGSIAFTRITWQGGGGNYFSDVLQLSPVGIPESLPRTAEFPSVAGPSWSPEGSQVAIEVIHGFYDSEGFGYFSDLYIVNAAASGSSPWRALTTNHQSSSPSWSPDGKRIAYLHRDPVSWYPSIHVVDAAGGTPVQLTKTPGWYGQPHWSPDGTRLVFSAFIGSPAVSEIYAVNADGSGQTRLPFAPESYDPNWSPDGSRLVFVHFRRSTSAESFYDVVVSDIDGRNVRVLATVVGSPGEPAWSPDGRQIVFALAGSLYVTNANGSGLVRVTNPAEHSVDRWPSWRR